MMDKPSLPWSTCQFDTVFLLTCRDVHLKVMLSLSAIQQTSEFTLRMNGLAAPFKSKQQAPRGPELRPRQTESPGTWLRELPENGRCMQCCAMASIMQDGTAVLARMPSCGPVRPNGTLAAVAPGAARDDGAGSCP